MPEPPPVFQHPAFQGLIGVSREDITPPVGIYARNWGAATHDVAEGIHRPLTATAITFQQQAEDAPLVLVSLDLGWWRSYKDEWELRGGLIDALGLDPARVMLSLTHTHAGPALCREDADKPGGHLIAPYLDSLRESVIRCVRDALANAHRAVLDWHTGKCALAQNRDLPDPDSSRFLSGFNPAGTADDTLLVGRVFSESSGGRQATLVNYACHPTTLAWQNKMISPDWVGAMREIVEKQTKECPCLYLHGASGELAPRQQYTPNPSVADRNGRQIGYSVLATLEDMLVWHPLSLRYSKVVESGAPLAVWKFDGRSLSPELRAEKIEVELPLKPMPTAAELEAQRLACEDRALAERLLRKRRIREGIGDGATAKMPVWIWRLGDSILLGHPNEAYSLLQTELRRRFPAQAIAVMNVVNGHFGYLPPADLFDQDIYPVWQSPFDRGCLELTIEACTNAIRRLFA